MFDPMRQRVCRIPDPEIVGTHTETYRKGSRMRRPFTLLNRKDLDAALATGCPLCGYKGTALRFFSAAGRTPPTVVHSSRTLFLKTLHESQLMCCNCYVEAHGFTHTRKGRAHTTGIDMSNTLSAIALENDSNV